MSTAQLARFLRGRRALLRQPATSHRRRRTPGLRREEVAERANISVDYYVRLEQARGATPSPRVLDALSSALELDAADRVRLFALARSMPTPPRLVPREVRPHVTALLGRLPRTAAIVTAATYDVIASNPLADALFAGLADEPNLARNYFLRGRHWTSASDDFAEVAVARLRAAATRYPDDPSLVRLLAELDAGSETFRALWTTDPTRIPGHRIKTVDHPVAGRVTVNCDVLLVAEDDQQVVLVTAEPGSEDERALLALSAPHAVPRAVT